MLWSACEVSCLWMEEQQELLGSPRHLPPQGAVQCSKRCSQQLKPCLAPAGFPNPGHVKPRERRLLHRTTQRLHRAAWEPWELLDCGGSGQSACAYTPPPLPVWTRALSRSGPPARLLQCILGHITGTHLGPEQRKPVGPTKPYYTRTWPLYQEPLWLSKTSARMLHAPDWLLPTWQTTHLVHTG